MAESQDSSMSQDGAVNALMAEVKRHDPDRYIATLYAPDESRAALWAVFAFAAELARLPSSISEAVMGEIRLEWWRIALDEAERGIDTGHPVAQALAPTIGANPIINPWLGNMIDGRARDISRQPLSNTNGLEAYFGETRSLPIRIAIHLLAPDCDERIAADCAGLAGVTLGLTGMLAKFPETVANAAHLLPTDLTSRHGIQMPNVQDESQHLALGEINAELLALAEARYQQAKTASENLPNAAFSALLPLAPIAGELKLLRNYNPASGQMPASRKALYRQWTMWRAQRRGRL